MTSRFPTRRRSIRAAFAVTLAVAVAAGTLSASGAGAQSVNDLQAQADAITSQLSSLNARSEKLDEQYNVAQVKLVALRAKEAANQKAVDAARASLDSNRSVARKYAINAFVTGGTLDTGVVSSPDTADTSRRNAFLSVLQGDRQQVIDDISASQQSLADDERNLAAARAKVDATVHDLADTKAKLKSTIDTQQQLLASVKGQLSTAVAAAQAKIEAAKQAAAEALTRQADALAQARAAAAASAQAAANTAAATAATATSDGTPTTTAPRGSSGFADPGLGGGPSEPAGIDVVLAAVRSQLGVPYLWAGASPATGFDCSGLMMWAFAKIGISLPHSAELQREMTRPVSVSQLEPGDLVFGEMPAGHVGIYIGGGMMINAPHTGSFVKVDPITYLASPASYGRL